MSERETGTIKFFNDSKGYGFISRAGQDDIFFHCSEFLNCDSVDKEDKVEFEVGEGRDGREAAIKIKLIQE